MTKTRFIVATLGLGVLSMIICGLIWLNLSYLL